MTECVTGFNFEGAKMRSLEMCDPEACSTTCDECEGIIEDPESLQPLSDEKNHSMQLAWWFHLCCFNYSFVGLEMAFRLENVGCAYPTYPWRVEAFLLLMQGFLSYTHDAHFAGRNKFAKWADRCCATFLTCCQPLKFAFCKMDLIQLVLLIAFWALGLYCFALGGKATKVGNRFRYQVFHTLWHIALPLGGYLWIEYTCYMLRAWQTQGSTYGFPADSPALFWIGVHPSPECLSGLAIGLPTGI